MLGTVWHKQKFLRLEVYCSSWILLCNFVLKIKATLIACIICTLQELNVILILSALLQYLIAFFVSTLMELSHAFQKQYLPKIQIYHCPHDSVNRQWSGLEMKWRLVKRPEVPQNQTQDTWTWQLDSKQHSQCTTTMCDVNAELVAFQLPWLSSKTLVA